jgi:hypothetical protein
MPDPSGNDADQKYLKLLMSPLELCAEYKPKFGKEDKKGVTLDGFRALYGDDPFYHWVGLDDELMSAAHKAAGGMTSVYRQLGLGCERLFRAIVRDSLGLSEEQVSWQYEIVKKDKSKGILKLDARIDLDHIADRAADWQKVRDWVNRCAEFLGYTRAKAQEFRGAIFEARQGYKSADAKRQNADLQFAMNALGQNYLPVLSVVSTQTSDSVIRRYKNSKMLVLTGTMSDDDTWSTFAFFRNAVGYPLDDFFRRNSMEMRERCRNVLVRLLTPA